MKPSLALPAVQAALRPATLLACATLAACATGPKPSGPIAWWHDLEGGTIAAQRPPPPDSHLPYPNLATVPARPKPIDPAERARVYAALTTDRANAAYEARQDPIAPPRAANGLFAAAKPLAAPAADNAGAALDASTPAPTTPAATPAPKPDPAPVPKPTPPAILTSLADSPVPDAPLFTEAPTIPDAPPVQPRLSGVAIPVTIPHLPPVAPPPAPPPPTPALTAATAAAIPIAFPAGSAILPAAQRPPLQRLAAARATHAIAITGYGDAAAPDPETQLAALKLAQSRARAIALALTDAGVPPAALRLSAAAPGRGAAARLID